MNENYQAESMENTEIAEGTPEVNLDAFDAGWDGDGFSTNSKSELENKEEAPEEEAEADQQEAEITVDNSKADDAADPGKAQVETEAEREKADQLFTLKHLDETREVSRDEVIALAQKGMDYDRKTGKLNDKIAEYEDFLNELTKDSGLNIPQFMDSVRARMYVEAEKKAGRTVSEAEALLRIQQSRAEKQQKAEEATRLAEQQQKETEKKQAENAVARFMAAYPDVKPTDIPQSVWIESRKTGDLLSAYVRHENTTLKKRLEALETNNKNAQRSTGSRKSAGSAKAKDEFDEGWDNI